MFDTILSMESLLIFLTAVLATTISSMSGGGSSVIAIPIFLSMGIPFPMATAMQQLNSTFWVLPSAYNYLKGRKIQWQFLIIYASIGMIGAYFGVLTVTSFNQQTLQRVIGVIILLLILFINIQKQFGLHERQIRSKLRERLVYLFALPMGFYEGLFGSGNGLFFSIISAYTKGFDLIDALGHYFAFSFFWVLLAALILISKGYFDLSLMIPAVLGSLTGGYIGSKFARFKGNKFIKMVFTISGIILGLKLLLGL